MNKKIDKKKSVKLTKEEAEQRAKEEEFDRNALNYLRFGAGRVSIDRRDTWQRTFDCHHN
jgi:hypothetical protein